MLSIVCRSTSFHPVFNEKTGERFKGNNAWKIPLSDSKFSGFRVKSDRARHAWLLQRVLTIDNLYKRAAMSRKEGEKNGDFKIYAGSICKKGTAYHGRTLHESLWCMQQGRDQLSVLPADHQNRELQTLHAGEDCKGPQCSSNRNYWISTRAAAAEGVGTPPYLRHSSVFARFRAL